MGMIKKIIEHLKFYFYTYIAKIKWKEKFCIDGIFRRHNDTQVIISENGRMKIGKNVSFQKRVSLSSVGGNLTIGSNVSFNRNCIVVCRDNIVIGADTIFGPGVTIYDHDHKFGYDGILSGYNTGSVIIEDGCWIAANVTILKNTHIGEGSVIGACTLVKGDIPPHSLVTSERKVDIVSIKKKD